MSGPNIQTAWGKVYSGMRKGTSTAGCVGQCSAADRTRRSTGGNYTDNHTQMHAHKHTIHAHEPHARAHSMKPQDRTRKQRKARESINRRTVTAGEALVCVCVFGHVVRRERRVRRTALAGPPRE